MKLKITAWITSLLVTGIGFSDVSLPEDISFEPQDLQIKEEKSDDSFVYLSGGMMYHLPYLGLGYRTKRQKGHSGLDIGLNVPWGVRPYANWLYYFRSEQKNSGYCGLGGSVMPGPSISGDKTLIPGVNTLIGYQFQTKGGRKQFIQGNLDVMLTFFMPLPLCTLSYGFGF